METKFYTTSDVMELLKISRQTVYNNVRDGKLKGNKVAEKWVFTEKQIEDYVYGRNK